MPNDRAGDAMTMPRNHVKEAAASGTTIRGVHLTFAAPAAIEVLADANLQFVYLDGEHGCFDWRDIETACITAERHGMTPIARIPELSTATITRFLDRGVRGIVVPHVESVAEAKRAVDAAYFAPLGGRSFGAGRPEYVRSGRDRNAYMAACNAAVSVGIMIESRAGLAVAEDIARLPGVDYLSFGMLDLAQSLGHPGDTGHADVRTAVSTCIDAIHRAGKRVREDFMNFAWINDVLMTGARRLLDDGARGRSQPYGMAQAGGAADD
jgi:4-hydroxy-2-oxoheptanedioate aldolase